MQSNARNICAIFSLIFTSSIALDITNLFNPFLPINLGKARLIYNDHIFIHYFNYLALENQIYQIYNNIQLLRIAYGNLTSNDSTISQVLSSISTNDIDHSYNTLIAKYSNLYPSAPKRTKRGLINPIGNLYNAAFGLLDAEDGARFEDAINKLSKNQVNMYKILNRQMSLSSKIIERFNNTISIIAANQQNIANQINTLQSRYDTFIITSLKLLTLQEIKRQLITNCITMIEIIEEIENAIMFAHLNSIHPSVIHNNEIQSMLGLLLNHYDSNNIIKFHSIISYYQLLSTQVYFENGLIIFTIHFPLVTAESYDMFQIIPIPQNNILTFPTTFYALQEQSTTLMIEQRCPTIEKISYCPPSAHQADACMKTTLLQQPPTDCSHHSVTLKTSLTQVIENNLIIVPKAQETIRTRCHNQNQILQLTGPVLIRLTEECTIEINNNTFDATRRSFNTVPLILPTIKMPDIPISQHHPVDIKDPELDKISDLKHLVKYPEPIVPVDIASHSYSSLILLLVLLIIAVIAFIIYRWFGCTLLQRKTKLIQVVANQLTMPKPLPQTAIIEIQPPQSLPQEQPQPSRRITPPKGNTIYPRL